MFKAVRLNGFTQEMSVALKRQEGKCKAKPWDIPVMTILTRAGHVKCRCSFASCKNVAR